MIKSLGLCRCEDLLICWLKRKKKNTDKMESDGINNNGW